MQLLELPLDVFRVVVTSVVRELGLKQSMRARFACRTLADEILDAVIKTRVIENVTTRTVMLMRIGYHHDVIARYLHHRFHTDRAVTHPWITTMRQTSRMLAQHTGSENDPARVEMLERSVCLCLAVNRGSDVFETLVEGSSEGKQLEDGMWANCLAVAAWIGDMALVESFNRGSDPLSLFGRPSWAAAIQGHYDVLLFFLNKGALPHEPTFVEGPNFNLSKSPLAAAAYMGRESIVQLYLRPEYYSSKIRHEEATAISYAAQGNQVNTLKILIEHWRGDSTPQELLAELDGALVWSCRRGAPDSARILLDYGADANETDQGPSSCLQLAAISGSAPLVKMLLDAGAELEAAEMIRHRSSGVLKPRRRRRDALTEAYLRDNTSIIRLIEEKQVEIYRSF